MKEVILSLLPARKIRLALLLICIAFAFKAEISLGVAELAHGVADFFLDVAEIAHGVAELARDLADLALAVYAL